MEPNLRRKALPLVQRAWLALLHVFLVLPFVVTKSCDDGTVQEFTGLEYYFAPERWVFSFVLVVVIFVLVARPWAGERSPPAVAALGLRAWAAAIGALTAIVGPFLAFLFDAPDPRVGWWIHGVGWGLTALGYLGLTAGLLVTGERPAPISERGGAERAGVVALLAAPPIALVLKAVFDPSEALAPYLLSGATGYSLALPLALGGVALVRALRGGQNVRLLRVGWWGATIFTVLAHVVAGVSK